MCQVSLVGYAVGGAFLSLAYFDLPYDILLLVVVAKRWLQESTRQETVALASRGASAGGRGESISLGRSVHENS